MWGRSVPWILRVVGSSIAVVALARAVDYRVLLHDNANLRTWLWLGAVALAAMSLLAWPSRPRRLTAIERSDLVATAILTAGLLLLDHRGDAVVRIADLDRLRRYFRTDIPRLEDIGIGIGLTIVGGGWLVRRWRPATPLADTPVASGPRQPRRWGVPLGVMLFGVASIATAWLSLELYDGAYGLWMIAVVGGAALAMVVGGFLVDAGTWRLDNRPEFSRLDLLLCPGITVVGAVVATWRIGSIPYVLHGDEGAFWELAQRIDDGLRPNIFGLGVYTFPMASNYLQAGIMAVVGDDFVGWRISSALPYVVATIPVYVLARAASGRLYACCASLTLITLPYGLAYARIGYNNSQAVPIVAGTLACGWFAYQRRSFGAMALAGVVAGLGFSTYTGARLGAVVMAVYAIVAGIRAIVARESARSRLKALGGLVVLNLLFAAALLTVVLPTTVYQSRWVDRSDVLYKTIEGLFFNSFYGRDHFSEAELYRDHPPLMVGPEELFYRIDLWFRLLGRGVLHFLEFTLTLDFAIVHLAVTSYAGAAVGLLGFLLGLTLAIRARRTVLGVLVLVTFVSGAVLLSIANSYPPRPAHFVPVTPAIALLVGWGISAVITRLAPPSTSPRWRRIAVPVVVCGALVVTSLRITFVEVDQRFPQRPHEAMLLDSAVAPAGGRWVIVSTLPFPPDTRFWSERLRGTQTLTSVRPGNLEAYVASLAPGEQLTVYWLSEDNAEVWPTLLACGATSQLRVMTMSDGYRIGYRIVVGGPG